MIQCNGKCAECSAYLNGEIESYESCAIATTQRRTFEIFNGLKNLAAKVEEISQKLDDEIFDKKINKKKNPPIVSDFPEENKNKILETE